MRQTAPIALNDKRENNETPLTRERERERQRNCASSCSAQRKQQPPAGIRNSALRLLLRLPPTSDHGIPSLSLKPCSGFPFFFPVYYRQLHNGNRYSAIHKPNRESPHCKTADSGSCSPLSLSFKNQSQRRPALSSSMGTPSSSDITLSRFSDDTCGEISCFQILDGELRN